MIVGLFRRDTFTTRVLSGKVLGIEPLRIKEEARRQTLSAFC
jgi:hypothetical protein